MSVRFVRPARKLFTDVDEGMFSAFFGEAIVPSSPEDTFKGSAAHYKCRRMALLLLNKLASEPGNRRLIVQLGVMDLLLTQLLLAPEEAQLSVTVANLTLVDDEVKQTLCSDEVRKRQAKRNAKDELFIVAAQAASSLFM